jgi:2-dehydropantoate 2-reductase
MRILVVGAGAIGGYFGGRLLAAGRDVRFLVRAGRAAELASAGLVIRSARGDATIAAPPTVLAAELHEPLAPHPPYDLVILSCKAYDLAGAIDSFAAAVGPGTAILPLLNGMQHLDTLEQRFGRARVLGGQCVIAATLDEQHRIVHLNDSHDLTYGELDGTLSARVEEIAQTFAGAVFDVHPSTQILQEMWEKWVFLATLAGATCLMRAAVGDIVAAPGGSALLQRLFDECSAIAQANGHYPRSAVAERVRATLAAPGSPMTASMLRDIERQAPIEADQVVGDLIRRAGLGKPPHPELVLLPVAYVHLKAYEARRAHTLPPHDRI